jgi:glycosyltransferase involved in cell wall biosynthesis
MVALPVPSRVPYLQQSIADYVRQTHARRELVIVINRADPATREWLLAHLASLGRDDVRVVERDDGLPLGALRNASLAEARGDLVCQWDDDDRYHPERIAKQVALLDEAGADALCLEEVLQWFPAERTMCCLNFRNAPARAMEGSLLMRRGLAVAYPEHGPTSVRGEDTVLVSRLHALGACATVAGHPHLYVYRSHGGNIWDDEHHRMLRRELAISKGLLKRRESALRAGLAAIDLGPDPVAVTGYNGVAFTLSSR